MEPDPAGNRPWEGVKPILQPKAPPRVVTGEQALVAIEQLRKEGDEFTADLVTLLTYSGLRISEALGLHWDDLNMTKGTMRIWRITTRTEDAENRVQIKERPKTRAGNRTLPIAKPVLEMLAQRQSATASPLVFPDPKTDRPLYGSKASIPISRVFKSLGYHGTAHGLRHGAITFMLEKGLPLNQVSKLAGHESSDITAKFYLAWADNEVAIDNMRAAMDD